MNRLEQLIAELCPDGVEYKALGEIGTMVRGNGLQKKDFTETGVGCIHYGQIYTFYDAFAYETKTFVSAKLAEQLKKVNKGDLVIAITSENVEDVCKCVAWLGEEEIVTGGHSAIFKHNQDPKYLSYYFQTSDFFTQKKKIANGTKVIEVSPQKLEQVIIPLPPLLVQNEIVRILDNFTELKTELTSELKTELTARKKQYEYYRDELLSFDEYETQPFGEIATIVRGASPRPIQNFITNDQSGVNWIKIGDVQPSSKYITYTKGKITQAGASKSRFVHPGDFVLTNSMSFGRPYIMKTEGCIHDGWLSISGFEKYFKADFLYHLLSSSAIQKLMAQRASAGTVKNLNADIVKALELPLPPLEEQERIVSILDRFDALCNDLTSGLPAEIEARRKQFEYYRDKLLTFKGATA